MEFVDFQGSIEDNTGTEDKVSDVASLKYFVDDLDAEDENDRTFYRNFENVTRLTDEALREEFSNF